MEYLDSLNKKYEKAMIGVLLAKYPKNIIYFYPKDGTPNCTIQAIDFSRLQKSFNDLGVGIIGVSKDNLDSHKEFALRNELTIPLLRDDASMLLGAYGALGPMTIYGNGTAVTDIVRSTYLVDSKGLPLAAWKHVVARGHADRLFEFVKSGK
jgi:thioredoxin-dependent peroxiredoxin